MSGMRLHSGYYYVISRLIQQFAHQKAYPFSWRGERAGRAESENAHERKRVQCDSAYAIK